MLLAISLTHCFRSYFSIIVWLLPFCPILYLCAYFKGNLLKSALKIISVLQYKKLDLFSNILGAAVSPLLLV